MASYSEKTYTFDGLKVQYGLGLAFDMAGKYPAITKRIFDTKAMAQAFIDNKDDSAVAGLTLAVIADTAENNGVYFVKSIGDGTTAGVLEKLGSSQGTSDVMSAVTALQEAVGGANKEAVKDGLTGSTAGNEETIVAAVNALDAALESVQTNFISGAVVNSVTGTVTDHVVSLTLKGDDIEGNVADGTYLTSATATVAADLKTLDSKIATLNGGATEDGSVAKAVADAKDELKGDAATAASGNTTIEGAKKYADEKVAEAVSDLEVTASGDAYVSAAQDKTDNKKIVVAATESTKTSLGKADSALQEVSATGDTYVSAEFDAKDGDKKQALTVSLTEKTTTSLGKADSALQEVSATGDTYVSASFTNNTDAQHQKLTVATTTKDVSAATTADNGLAVAADVKAYVDAKGADAKTTVSKVNDSYSGLTITADTTAADGHTDYKVSLTDVASAAELKSWTDKVAASKTLDNNLESTLVIKYVAATDDKAAHLALVGEDAKELSTIAVADIIGNGVLDHSAYNNVTGILTLYFMNADGTTTPYDIDVKAMLDMDDILVDADSQKYLSAHTIFSESGDTQVEFAVLTAKVSAATTEEKSGLADAKDVKDYVDSAVSGKNVDAEGETDDAALVSASAADNKVSVSSTQKLKDAVTRAEGAVLSVTKKDTSKENFVALTVTDGDYVTITIDDSTLKTKIENIEGHDTDTSGSTSIVGAKKYADELVASKNVDAEGETDDAALVSASATDNKVTVSSTTKLQNAVTRAEGAVLSVTKDTSVENFVTLTVTDADDAKVAINDSALKTKIDEIDSAITAETSAREAQDNKIEASVGLDEDGSHVTTTGHYTSGATTIAAEIAALDDAVYSMGGNALTGVVVNTVTATVANNVATVTISADKIAADTAVGTKAATDSVKDALAELDSLIDTLNGEATEDGSVKKAVADAKAELIGTATTAASSDDTIKGAKKYADEAASGAVDALNLSDSAVTSEFVTKVDQTKGQIAVSRAAITSNDKTVTIDGYDFAVNIDGASIVKDADGKLSVASSAITVTGENAIVATSGDSGTKVSLKINDTEDDAVALTQDANGLKATLNIASGNTATEVTETNGGILLTNTTDGLGANLYWGTF